MDDGDATALALWGRLRWQLIAPLDLGDGRQVASPPLPFAVTA